MSDVFGAMNDAASHENTTENQGRKSGAGIDFVGHLPGNDTGFQSSYVMNSMQTNSDPSMGYSQQSLFNNQISNYNSGVDYSQSGIRLDVSNNGGIEHELRQPVPSSYQHSYTQPHVSINNGMNLNTGPVINGNYSTLKHMHPHNLSNSETFGSAPQQPIVHQYTSTVLQQNSSNLHSNPNQSVTQLPPGHSMSLSNDQLISRNISSHNPNSVPMSVHSMQTDNVSGISGSVSNQYIPMNRSVGIISQHHLHSNSQHQSPPQNYQIGGQPNLHYGNPSSANGNFQVNNANSSRSTISKVWHSSDHAQLREGVAEEIVKILKSRKPNAGDGWHDKLPHMAKRLEDALYQEASSYEEYADRNTLKHRLQQLALTMGSKNQSKPPLVPQNSGPLPPNASSAPAHQPQIVRQPQTHPNYSLPYMQNVQPQSHMHIPQHPPSQVSSQYSSYPPSQGPRSQLPSQYSQMSSMHGSVPISTSTAYPTNSTDYSNALVSQSGMRNVAPLISSQGYLPLDSVSNADGYSRNFSSSLVSSQQAPGQQGSVFKTEEGNHFGSHTIGRPQPMLQSGSATNVSIGGSISNNLGTSALNNQNSDEHRKQVLKQQQQRLLLLRHASKCPHESGRCPVTPHCWNMKQLWKHIMSCKDQDCKVAHCVSSRYVLSHYSKCKEPTCPVCGPVREAIKRNYERSRDVVKMARNPNLGPPLPGNSQQLGMPTLTNSGAPMIKGDEPEKKKIRRKSDVVTTPNTSGGSQVPQPLVIRQPPRKIYPLDPISSAIYSFTNDQIQAHFRTIHEGLRLTVGKIKEMCKPLLEEIFRIPHAQGVFGSPVDPISLGLADYFDVVKVPMDLGTVLKKLDAGSYRDLSNFVSDIHLTFDNAMLYNPKNTDVYLLASNLKKEFDRRYRLKVAEFEKQIEENRKNKDACLVCGEVALKYEPPVYYCNGTCAQRIRRNAVFYSNNTNTYHWCSLCFNAMKDNDVIRFPDCSITKAELAANKKKHIEESGEGWVECEGGCKRWVHQICSLFNNRRNVSDDVSYVCPLCLQEKRRKSPNEEIVAQSSKKMKASDLPVTTLSDFLEKRILKRLELAYEETSQKFGLSLANVERCPTLTLRQVSCVDKLQPVREGFYQRYKDRGYPTDFPCRSKCLVLFQNIDGQDVILFGMYVYEYGHKCPQPNQRRVYISYLDSVHYLRPKQYRTLVYHEILISYLDYMKARGFHTVHIWACPPQKGDDYILYVHPQDQKTPKPQILRLWYDEMLKRCVERGIVCEMTDLHTEYLVDPNIEVTSLPYFEGDYWVNEAEVIIKNLTDGRRDDDVLDELSGSKSKRRSKSKRPGKVAASSLGISRSERDPLMAKLAAIIEPMKDTFFVARLHPKEFADKFLISVPEGAATEESNKEKSDQELQEEALSGQDIVPQLPEMETSKVSSKGSKRAREDDEMSQRETPPEEEDDSEDDFLKNATFITANSDGRESTGEERERLSSTPSLDGKSEGADAPLASSSSVVETSTQVEIVEQDCLESKEAVAQAKQIDRLPSSGTKTIACGEDMPSLPEDTEDVDDIQESEHFDTRQSFLNLCQGNHYQFDQLRRAKHSSMMVLYHLHNPDAPKFVPSCGNCHLDILTGTRYRCEKCELDYCQSCFSRLGNSIHNHPLRPMNGGNSAPTKLTEEQRRERQRSIQLHMQLLNHAANCVKCESRNCAKMKDFLLHESQCKIKSAGGCRLCSRISNLLNIHARSCRIENCKVPQCLKLREQFRQLALSQQRMDDRRRKKMNSEYNRGATDSRVEEDDN